MTRRQPGALTLTLCHDFDEVDLFRGYTYFEAHTAWLEGGTWRTYVLRETRTGRALTDLALAGAAGEDLARWTVVARPEGESRVLASLRVQDIDADFGFAEGAAADTVQVYGDTYTAMLETVPLTPSATVAPSSTSVTTWPATVTRTGPAEDVALSLIADYFGPTAPVPGNRFARLNIPASLHRGATVTFDTRFPTLLEELRPICLKGGITVRLEQGAPGVVDVVVTEQLLREDVVLSTGQNTLLAWRVRRSTARATGALALGRGEDTERATTYVAAPAPTGGWAYPRQVTVTAGGETDLEPLRAAAREELADLNPALAVSLRPSPTSRHVPGIDFDLGDVLPVAEAGADLTARCTEIAIVDRPGGAPDLTAEVGPGVIGPVAAVLNQLQRVVRRETTNR